jgi:hypothetical protein
MRKLLLSLATLFFVAGLVMAAEVTLVKYDEKKKELTVKDDKDKEKTYKITDKTKILNVDKDGNAKEAKLADVEMRLTGEKAPGRKLEITADGDKLTELKIRGRGKKNE